jgi:hypothetical protein
MLSPPGDKKPGQARRQAAAALGGKSKSLILKE